MDWSGQLLWYLQPTSLGDPCQVRRRTAKTAGRIPSSDQEFEAQKRAFHVIASMRKDGISLQDAAREEGTKTTTVKKYLPAALRKTKVGQWVTTKSDRYVRLVSLPGPHGPVVVEARGSKKAQFASAYLSSLGRWRRSHKASELAPFHGKRIGAFKLITAPRTLEALDDAGLLQLDSLYASVKETL